ncbi:hypothetical protein NNC19_18000 [Clostridium sp. SHJSY1]|uniref:hypothetical protein n=1 Tax=Clostridium sp. SHJSY1 TaxID=2942483 RepID=UPI002876AB56|nr:hypothetical protein [Clostridium sp. SHJSY1]MDS0527587.1 hypothetical protein [Clostridium sp. SHJSY1]
MRFDDYIGEMINKLTVEEDWILVALNDGDWANPLRVKDLIELTKLKKTTINVYIRKFIFLGWVTIITNKRSQMYYLTGLGENVVRVIIEKYNCGQEES